MYRALRKVTCTNMRKKHVRCVGVFSGIIYGCVMCVGPFMDDESVTIRKRNKAVFTVRLVWVTNGCRSAVIAMLCSSLRMLQFRLGMDWLCRSTKQGCLSFAPARIRVGPNTCFSTAAAAAAAAACCWCGCLCCCCRCCCRTGQRKGRREGQRQGPITRNPRGT